MLKIVATTLLMLAVCTSSLSQKINTEAIDKFWETVAILEADKPLTDSLWDNYYNVFGNRHYMESNRSDSEVTQHRRFMEYIFRPSMQDSCKKIERTINMGDDQGMFQNLFLIKQHETEMKAYSKVIASSQYLNLSIALAKKFLPNNKFNPLPKDLTVYIMAMTSDAAVQPPNMYLGLPILYNFDRFQKGSIAAHEFHHFLRKQKEFTGSISKRDSASYSIIYQINNEGCADLVDKPILLNHVSVIFGGKSSEAWLLNTAAATLQKLDSCFIQNTKTNTDFVTRKQFREITGYSSGHIPGFYMTTIITRNGLKQELINHCDNPFTIFYLYNKAAKKDPTKPPLFSEASIAYLKKMEIELNRKAK